MNGEKNMVEQIKITRVANGWLVQVGDSTQITTNDPATRHIAITADDVIRIVSAHLGSSARAGA